MLTWSALRDKKWRRGEASPTSPWVGGFECNIHFSTVSHRFVKSRSHGDHTKIKDKTGNFGYRCDT